MQYAVPGEGPSCAATDQRILDRLLVGHVDGVRDNDPFTGLWSVMRRSPHTRLAIAVAMLMSLALSVPARAADELTTKLSNHSVKETLDRLTAALKDKGITPTARVDHAAAAKAVGLELPPTEVLLFGNPRLGTPLMQASRQIAIDNTGKVWIAYTTPETLKARYRIEGKDDALKTMAGVLEALTSTAAN
jgi:uncharacterized protein (DUF302 family)